MVDIIYRADLTVDLSYSQVDANFRALATAVEALQSDRPTPNQIASLTQTGLSFSFNLENGGTLGPVTLPVVSIHFFSAWTPFTYFVELDTIVVDGVGIFATMLAHTTGAIFNPELAIGADPVYRKLFGFAPDGGSSIVYDVEFQYQGVLGDALRPPVNFLALRAFRLPSSANGEHLAFIDVPAVSERQVLPILHGAVEIGTVTFEIADNNGTVEIADDEDFAFGDHLVIGLPGAADATAAGVTIALALRRIV